MLGFISKLMQYSQLTLPFVQRKLLANFCYKQLASLFYIFNLAIAGGVL